MDLGAWQEWLVLWWKENQIEWLFSGTCVIERVCSFIVLLWNYVVSWVWDMSSWELDRQDIVLFRISLGNWPLWAVLALLYAVILFRLWAGRSAAGISGWSYPQELPLYSTVDDSSPSYSVVDSTITVLFSWLYESDLSIHQTVYCLVEGQSDGRACCYFCQSLPLETYK